MKIETTLLRAQLDQLLDACTCVVATAHGNRYGLSVEEVLEAQLMAAREVQRAMPPEIVQSILARASGFVDDDEEETTHEK